LWTLGRLGELRQLEGVRQRDSAGIALGPHALGEVQERQALGDVRLAAADPLGEHPLGVPELLDEPPVRLGLLQAFEPSTLAILNEADFEGRGRGP
jgi:hypothetical protein